MAKEKDIIYTAGSDFHSLKKVDLKHGTFIPQVFHLNLYYEKLSYIK